MGSDSAGYQYHLLAGPLPARSSKESAAQRNQGNKESGISPGASGPDPSNRVIMHNTHVICVNKAAQGFRGYREVISRDD